MHLGTGTVKAAASMLGCCPGNGVVYARFLAALQVAQIPQQLACLLQHAGLFACQKAGLFAYKGVGLIQDSFSARIS
jgi:hypothetical protein